MITVREAILSLATLPGGPGGSVAGNRITTETVEAVSPTGQHTVLGRMLPVTGLATFPVGARVPVAWKDGIPVAIIGHRWRRAQFHPSFRVSTQGIVEELLVTPDDVGPTVWYRNHSVFVPVATREGKLIREVLDNKTPETVKWGMDGKSFAVQCEGGYYAVFIFDREDANLVEETAPWTAERHWMGRPLEVDTPLISVDFKCDTQYADKYFICEEEYVYTTTKTWQPAHYSNYYAMWIGAHWQYDTYLGEVKASFGGDVDGGGSASGSVSYNFTLKALLHGTIVDGNGAHTVSASVEDWYLDEAICLQFVIRVEWDYFRIQANNVGGTITGYTCFSEDGLHYLPELRATHQSFSGGSTESFIGARKPPALGWGTISEAHFFLFNGMTGAVTWKTAAGGSLGYRARHFSDSAFMKIITTKSYPDGGPEGQAPGDKTSSSYYYAGANFGYMPNTFIKDAGGFYSDSIPIGNENQQLLDPACPLFPGPYVSQSDAGMGAKSRTLKNWYYYRWDFRVGTRNFQRLWFYRVTTMQVFSVREKRGEDDVAYYVDVPRFFVVAERYPFIPGTNYINDIPQIGVFILDADGTIRKTVRGYQYGLAGGALVSGDGHRVIWDLWVGSVLPKTITLVTDFDQETEREFNPSQLTSFLGAQARLYPPDFLWTEVEPPTFYPVADLPDLNSDDVLEEHAKLLASEGVPATGGSIRMVNDPNILDPLERYQET